MVIARGLVGGSCPNIACLPSKNLIRSAKVADLVRHASHYGVQTTPGTIAMEGVRQRKRETVDGVIEIHRKRFAVPNLEFVLGEGRFIAPRTIEVRLAEGRRPVDGRRPIGEERHTTPHRFDVVSESKEEPTV